MAIAYKSQGSGVATETSGAACSPASPATVDANDILIIHAYFEGTATAPSTPSGFVLLSGPHVVETTIGRHWVYGKIAAGNEDGAANALGTQAVTTMRSGRCYSFSGFESGTITDLVVGFSATTHATDPQMPTVTTTVAGGLAVALVLQNDNNALVAATGETGGDWIEAVAEFTSALTPGLVLQIQTCTPTGNPGTVTGGSVAATNDPSGVVGFEIRPNNTVKQGQEEAESPFTGSGTDDGTFVEAGAAISAFVSSGVGGKEYEKASATILVAIASGTGFIEQIRSGSTTSTFIGEGGDSVESMESGSAISARVAIGDGEQSQENAGIAVASFVGSGRDEIVVSRTGGSISDQVSSGARQTEHLRSGIAQAPFVAVGSDEAAFAETAVGIVSFISSGQSQVGGDILKQGAGTTTFTGFVSDACESVESGSGSSIFVASGSGDLETTRSGSSAILFIASGNYVAERPAFGSAVVSLHASGQNEETYAESGSAQTLFVGRGAAGSSETSKSGSALMGLSAGATVVDYVVIEGPTVVVSLRVPPRASIRRISPE